MSPDRKTRSLATEAQKATVEKLKETVTLLMAREEEQMFFQVIKLNACDPVSSALVYKAVSLVQGCLVLHRAAHVSTLD